MDGSNKPAAEQRMAEAAPEMYAALVSILNSTQIICVETRVHACPLHAARAAVEKAEGR